MQHNCLAAKRLPPACIAERCSVYLSCTSRFLCLLTGHDDWEEDDKDAPSDEDNEAISDEDLVPDTYEEDDLEISD